MAIGTLTMILTNVGLSLFNNWQASRQSAKLQSKKEEFELAAQGKQLERMWKLMREGQELTLLMEEERHKNRMKDLKNDMDNLVKRLTYDATISHWPLNVLPMVMKNQAIGNILANKNDGVALHCILTPSNNQPFNREVFPLVERELESFCNRYWSTMTEHPILFYSGAWSGPNEPSGPQIESLKKNLNNLPTLLITPIFRPTDGKLTFQINIWGVDAYITDEYNHTQIIEPNDYQTDYTDKENYDDDLELVENAVEDIVPYLQCLIGYFADSFFWSAFGHIPQLPKLIKNDIINTDGMKYLINDSLEYYSNLLAESERVSLEQPFNNDNLLNLYEGISVLWDEKTKYTKLEELFNVYCNKKTCNHTNSCYDISQNIFNYDDIPMLNCFQRQSNNKTLKHLGAIISVLSENKPKRFTRKDFPQDLYTTVELQTIDFVDILDEFTKYCKNYHLSNIDILIRQDFMQTFMFHTYDSKKDQILYFNIPFNRSYKIKEMRKSRNVNSIFAYGKTKEISCNISRIQILKEKLLTDQLMF